MMNILVIYYKLQYSDKINSISILNMFQVVLVHGHWYYYRVSLLVQYFFYKVCTYIRVRSTTFKNEIYLLDNHFFYFFLSRLSRKKPKFFNVLLFNIFVNLGRVVQTFFLLAFEYSVDSNVHSLKIFIVLNNYLQ